jgi:hypothetical protein
LVKGPALPVPESEANGLNQLLCLAAYYAPGKMANINRNSTAQTTNESKYKYPDFFNVPGQNRASGPINLSFFSLPELMFENVLHDK